MRTERVIADSDDEEGFSPLSSPNKSSDATQPASEATRSSNKTGTGSTDPRFFKSVYDAQCNAAAVNGTIEGRDSVVDPVEVTSDQLAAENYDATEASDSNPYKVVEHASSAGNEKGARKRGTPGKTPLEKDLWAILSSPPIDPLVAGNEQRKVSVKTTYAKRNHRSSSASASSVLNTTSPIAPRSPRPSARKAKTLLELVGTEELSPLPARKRRRLDQRSDEAMHDDDILALEMPPPSTRRRRRGRSKVEGQPPYGGSTARNKNGLFVEPSKLTSSQRDEYEEVEVPSTDPIDDDMPPTAPMPSPPSKSSGSETILYPTPTPFHRDPQQDSSLISTLPPPSVHLSSANKVSSGHQQQALTSSHTPPPQANASTTRSRRSLIGLVVQDDEWDDDWNEEDFGFPKHGEQRAIRQSKQIPKQELRVAEDELFPAAGDKEDLQMNRSAKKARRTARLVGECAAVFEEENIKVNGDEPEDPTEWRDHEDINPRIRIRGKKGAVTDADDAVGQSLDDMEEAQEDEYPVPKSKRRRKKVEMPNSEDDLGGEEVDCLEEENTRQDICSSRKRGRPKKVKVLDFEGEPGQEAVGEGGDFINSNFKDELEDLPQPKKRGRRKNAVAAKSAETVQDSDTDREVAEEVAEEPPKRKRGRPKKIAMVDKGSVKPDIGLEAAKTGAAPKCVYSSAQNSNLLAETSVNTIQSPAARFSARDTDVSEHGTDVDQENVKSVPKEGRQEVTCKVTQKQQPPIATKPSAKPSYRVGLSKRSRIAPLLKTIRKS